MNETQTATEETKAHNQSRIALLNTSIDISHAVQWLKSGKQEAIEKALFWLERSREERKAANETNYQDEVE